MTNAGRIGLFFAALYLCVPGLSQTGGVVSGEVLDGPDGAPIQGVHVRISYGGEQVGPTVTDRDGRFSLAVPRRHGGVLHLSHVGHVAVNMSLDGKVDGAPLRVVMEVAVIDIPEVVVRRHGPEEVYKRPDLHVGGHHVTKDGVWVLAYERPRLWHRQEHAGERLFREARVVLLDTSFREVAARRLPGEVRGMYRDHRGRPVVDGRDAAWVAEWRDPDIMLGRIGRDTLHRMVLPWTDSTAGHIYGSGRTATWPAFDHLAFDPVKDTQWVVCSVSDDHVMGLFRGQYKYMSGRDKVIAMDMELRTGIEREIVAGYMTGFHHDPYFKVPYAPMFIVSDTLCVFDHVKGGIKRFTPVGEAIDEVPMRHIDDRAWRGELLQDAADATVYALFARGGRAWLCAVDVSTGGLGPPSGLTYRFPEDVRVHGGHAYYVYRPQGGLDHRTLYREPLR